MYKTNSSSKRCRICFCELIHHQTFLEILFGNDVLCTVCRSKLSKNPKIIHVNDLVIETMYLYEGEARQLFLQFKEGHDRLLAPAFLYGQRWRLRMKYRGFQIMTVPSHENAVKHRGFNVVDELIFGTFCGVSQPGLRKAEDRYQKRLNKEERFRNPPKFTVDISFLDKNRPVLLVDDLVTTGATLSHLSQTLTKNGLKVQIFSVYRHKMLES